MTGTVPIPVRQGPPPYKHKRYYPMVIIRMEGPGWGSSGSRRVKVPNKLYHMERWTRTKDLVVNVITARKNKRDYPEFPPIPFVS